MYIVLNRKKGLLILISIVCCIALIVSGVAIRMGVFAEDTDEIKDDFIKWVDFNIPYSILEKAMNLDIKSQDYDIHLNWIELLAYSAAKCGGNFKNFKTSRLDEVANEIYSGKTIKELTKDLKHYPYFYEAYNAVLSGFLGDYEIEVKDESSPTGKSYEYRYGLKVFSPVAAGYYYNHYDDFGNSRDYGYRRRHLGNDLMGSIGTPIIAVETGYIEALGWNQYGGWRIGIRSLDKKRYYYYAHLRQSFPYHKDLKEGDVVKAGDVIGYLGRTGYSRKEDANNIRQAHLHFGMQLIFNESQKESYNEIWINVYNIVKLLSKNKSSVVMDKETKDFNRLYDIKLPDEDQID